MKISFLILNYNSWKTTEKLAKKVQTFACVDRIVIVDNVSTDDSYEQLLKMKSNKIDIIRTKKNGGYSYGNNVGVQYCDSIGADIIFISNPDVDIEEKDIILLLEQFKATDYSLLTAVQYEFDGTIGQPPVLNKRTFGLDLLECCFVTRKFWAKKGRGVEVDYLQNVQPIEMFRGSFFGIRVKDFLEVGGFDEEVFLYNEEAIFARRMLDLRKKMGLVTRAKYHHMHSESVSRVYKLRASRMKLLYESRLYYHVQYNKINIMKKNVLRFSMTWSLVEFTIFDTICYIRNKLKRN